MAEISSVGRLSEVEVACGARRHAIDASGRFALPQSFIDALGASFYITVDDRSNLVLFPANRFKELATCWKEMRASRRLAADPTTVKAIQRTVFFAEPIKADSNNRVQIPDSLKAVASSVPRETVCIVGDLDRIVLWEVDAYEKYGKVELCNEGVTKRQGDLLYLTPETFHETRPEKDPESIAAARPAEAGRGEQS